MIFIDWANVFATIAIVGAVFLAVWFIAYAALSSQFDDRKNRKEVRPNVRRKW